MTDEPAMAARAGLLRGDLGPFASYLRSFGDPVLRLAADMIEADNENCRITVERNRAAQRSRTESKRLATGLFIFDQVMSDVKVEAAVMAAMVKFRVGRSTAMAAWTAVRGDVYQAISFMTPDHLRLVCPKKT